VLIVPLHRAPTWSNFPWVTLALILANVFVFAFLQSGDARIEREALDYYAQQHLAQWEFPAYRTWLDAHDDAQRREWFEAFAEANEPLAAQVLQSDDAFLAELRGDRLVTPDAKNHAQWRERRDEFDQLWNRAFTERWKIRFSEFDPRRMFGAMFLHGGVGHLIGNMIFLALLGLLVEGALGHGLFLAVYLLGGLGSAMLSVAYRWGDTGSALGASGAIASLMGAYCVLWGLRKVRFFWWFFVVFDYVKAPALVLLPFWLGWELLNLAWNKGAHVGFDAHAGGIVVGALLALGVRALHWEKREFLDEYIVADAQADRAHALAQAREHIGHLQIPAARALLEPLAQAQPDDFDVCAALYRCARLEPRTPNLEKAARAVLALTPRAAAQAREQKAIFEDALKAGLQPSTLDAAQMFAMLRRWPMLGGGADAAKLLVQWIERAPSTPGLPAACLGVARDLRARRGSACENPARCDRCGMAGQRRCRQGAVAVGGYRRTSERLCEALAPAPRSGLRRFLSAELVEELPICGDLARKRMLRIRGLELVEQRARLGVLAHALGEELGGEQVILRDVGVLRITLVKTRHELERDLRVAGIERLLRDARDFVGRVRLECGIEIEAFARDVDGAAILVESEQDADPFAAMAQQFIAMIAEREQLAVLRVQRFGAAARAQLLCDAFARLFRFAVAHELRGVVERFLIRIGGDAAQRRGRLHGFVADFVVVLVDEIAHQVERRDDRVVGDERRNQRGEEIRQDRRRERLCVGLAQEDDEAQRGDREVRPAEAREDRKPLRGIQRARQVLVHRQRHRRRGIEEAEHEQADERGGRAEQEEQRDRNENEEDLQEDLLAAEIVVDVERDLGRFEPAIRRIAQALERVFVERDPDDHVEDEAEDQAGRQIAHDQRRHRQRGDRRQRSAMRGIQRNLAQAIPERFDRVRVHGLVHRDSSRKRKTRAVSALERTEHAA
jgi:membrane associated rhomboid family serine protease